MATLDPQPLEDGFAKRAAIGAGKVILANSAMIFLVVAAFAAIYSAISIIGGALALPIAVASGLFALSISFLYEHKRSGFEFFSASSINFLLRLMWHDRLIRIILVLNVLLFVSRIFIGEPTPSTDEKPVSEPPMWLIVILVAVILSAAAVAVFFFAITHIVNAFKYFVVIHFNLAKEIFETKTVIDDVPGLKTIAVYSLFDIKRNKQVSLYIIGVYMCFMLGTIFFVRYPAGFLYEYIYSAIMILLNVLFTLFLYQVHREILLGKRKVKQEESSTDFNAVPEAS